MLRSETSAAAKMKFSNLKCSSNNAVCQFKVPKINVGAKHYFELANLDNIKYISQLSVLMTLGDSLIAEILTKPLILLHLCHNQDVERYVKLVTEAASVVTGCEKRDGLIRQKIQSFFRFKYYSSNYAMNFD